MTDLGLSTFLHENKIFTRPNMHENKIFKPSPHIRKCTIYQITTKNHWLLPLLQKENDSFLPLLQKNQGNNIQIVPVTTQGSVENYWGIDCALLPNREWNQKQKPKKQPWSKVECFAFGGATVRFASLETSFHAANHTIPPPPSNEGYPLCTKDKNRSPFHGEKPLIKIILWQGRDTSRPLTIMILY